jgi:hypothetical protein
MFSGPKIPMQAHCLLFTAKEESAHCEISMNHGHKNIVFEN